MGEVIELKDQLADRSRPRGGVRAAFFYDVACPFSYLVAERVERVLGEVEWVPAPAVGLDGGARWPRIDATRELAERYALAARLPLVWPDRFPANARHALRAASYAAENGAGGCGAVARGGNGKPTRGRVSLTEHPGAIERSGAGQGRPRGAMVGRVDALSRSIPRSLR